jgi:hypothetical protein
MVIFALSKTGFNEVKPFIESAWPDVWVNKGVLSQKELYLYRNKGVNLTDFTYQVDKTDSLDIKSAVQIIKKYHPEDTIWVEN